MLMQCLVNRVIVLTWLIPALAWAAAGQTPSSRPFYPDKLDLLHYISPDGQSHQVSTAAQWDIRRGHILDGFRDVLGPLPGKDKAVPLQVKVLEEVEQPAYIQRKITYMAERDDAVPAYLLIPKQVRGKMPAVLCLHQSVDSDKREPVGLYGKPNLFYAKELTERGYITLTPDYPHYGDYKIDVYAKGYASVTGKGVWNHIRGLDLLQSMPEVDGTRIGCMGHSLGGYNAVFVAALDERIKVTVSSCGFCSFRKYRGGRIEPWGSPTHHMPRISTVYGNDPGRVPFDFTEILAAIAPRALFANSPVNDGAFPLEGAQDCIRAARPVFELLGVKERLVAEHPNCPHDFPPEVRERAYSFMDSVLRSKGGKPAQAATSPAR